MKNRTLLRDLPSPPRVAAPIAAARPQQASGYRLKCIETARYFPPLEQAAAHCTSAFVKPIADLVTGMYEVVYYREPANPDTVIDPPVGCERPILQVSQDAVVLTAADYETQGLRGRQSLERREDVSRGTDKMARDIELLTRVNERLTKAATERDQAQLELMVKFAALQQQMNTSQAALVQCFDNQTASLNRNLVAFSDTAIETLGKIPTDNLYSLGREVIRMIVPLVNAKLAADAKARRARLPRDQESAGSGIVGRPEHAEHAPQAHPRYSEAPPLPALTTARAPAVPVRVPVEPRAIEIDWLEVCGRCSDELAESVPYANRAGDEEAPAMEPIDAMPSPMPPSALEVVPEEIRDLASQIPELERLLASLGVVSNETVERPEDWSYTWAWDAIRRRIAQLSDTSIAWILSSSDNALGFLRQLAELATPPPEMASDG